MRVSQLLADAIESAESSDSIGSAETVDVVSKEQELMNDGTLNSGISNNKAGVCPSELGGRKQRDQQHYHPSQTAHLTHLTHVPVGYQLVLVPTEALSRFHSNASPTSSIFNARSVPSNSHFYPVPNHITAFNPLSRHLLPSPAGSESSDTICNLETLADLALVGPAVNKAPKAGGASPHIPTTSSNDHFCGFKTVRPHQYNRPTAHRESQKQHACLQIHSQYYSRTPTQQLDLNLISPKDIFLEPINSTRRRYIPSNGGEESDCDEDAPAFTKKRKPGESHSNTSHSPHAISTTELPQDFVSPSPTEAPTSKKLERRYVCPHYGQPKAKRSKYGDLSRAAADPNDSICNAKFLRRQEMERHLASVHGSEEDKGWVCPGPIGGKGCGKRYARADALRKHLVSSRSRNVADGCSYGLSEEGIVAMVKVGATAKRL